MEQSRMAYGKNSVSAEYQHYLCRQHGRNVASDYSWPPPGELPHVAFSLGSRMLGCRIRFRVEQFNKYRSHTVSDPFDFWLRFRLGYRPLRACALAEASP